MFDSVVDFDLKANGSEETANGSVDGSTGVTANGSLPLPRKGSGGDDVADLTKNGSVSGSAFTPLAIPFRIVDRSTGSGILGMTNGSDSTPLAEIDTTGDSTVGLTSGDRWIVVSKPKKLSTSSSVTLLVDRLSFSSSASRKSFSNCDLWDDNQSSLSGSGGDAKSSRPKPNRSWTLPPVAALEILSIPLAKLESVSNSKD